MVSPVEWVQQQVATLGIDCVGTPNEQLAWQRFYAALAQQQVTDYYTRKFQDQINKADPLYRVPPPPPPCPTKALIGDPDGPLVPLSVPTSPAPRPSAPTHDYIAALYRPYTPPV